MSASYTAEEAVAAGAAWLDEKFPGWHKRIDVKKLSTLSSKWCPFGQTVGVADEDAEEWNRARTKFGMTADECKRFGFNKSWNAPYEWSDLDASWRALIVDRLTAPTAADKPRIADVAAAHGVDFTEIVRRHAREMDKIYRHRTAGDYTWTGVLMNFVHELEGF